MIFSNCKRKNTLSWSVTEGKEMMFDPRTGLEPTVLFCAVGSIFLSRTMDKRDSFCYYDDV